MERFSLLKEQGKQKLLAKQYAESIDCYKEAAAAISGVDAEVLTEQNVVLGKELAILHTNIGVGYFEQKQYDAALASFKKAQECDQGYDKAYYRAAVCLERMGENADALLAAKKISPTNKDQDVMALQTRLMKVVTDDNKMRVIMPKLKTFLEDKHLEEVILVAKDGPNKGKTTKESRYKNEKEIEYALLMMAKGIEEGAQLFDLIVGFHEFYEILKLHNLQVWKQRLSSDLYLRLLGTVSLIFESISARDMEKSYMLLSSQEMSTIQENFCKYLWDQYINHSAGKDVKELLSKYPLFLMNINLMNSVSIWIKIGSDKANTDDTEFFLSVIYNRAKLIKECKSDTVKNLEKSTLEEESKKFSEFVERVSKVNSKASKSFLVTFFKAVNAICGFEIYKLLFKNIAHLYRDNFSFQSILLMNSILLSSYPSILETFIKQEPLFLPSISNLAEHLHYMLQEGNHNDLKVQFKMENTFQLLFLCLSNKPFLTAISSSKSEFRTNLKRFLEVSYQLQEDLPPQIVAKSLVCTAVTILEVFPNSMALLDEMIPLSKIAHLLKLVDSVETPPFEVGDYVSDILDTLNYICKSEHHVGRVALNNEIFKYIKKALEKVKKGRYLVLHSAVSLASSLLNDKTKRNFEIANDKWGCDMEGFLLLEKVRDKASRDTPTLVGPYTSTEIKSSGVKMKLLKDMGIAFLIAEYFSDCKSENLTQTTHENTLTFLLDLAEEKEYRSYMVNKALIVYLNECFTNKASSKRLKNQVSQLVATIGAAINPNVLSYPLQYFVVDILCHTIDSSSQEIYIFESLLALVNFTGSNSEFGHRVFFKNQSWAAVYGHIFDENVFIGNAALELINNLLLNEKVYERIATVSGFQGQLDQMFGVADLYLQEGLQEYTDKKVDPLKPVRYESQLTKYKTFLSIICILDGMPERILDFTKKLRLQTICSLFALVKDKEYLSDIAMKLKFLATNLLKNKASPVKIDKTVSERIREFNTYFTSDETRMIIAILGE